MDINLLQTEQDKYKEIYGKNFQIERGEKKARLGDYDMTSKITDGTDFEVFEYVGANGATGYTHFEYRIQDSQKQVKATGFGINSATYDWRDIHPIPK